MDKVKHFIKDVERQHELLRPLNLVISDKKWTYGKALWDYEDCEENWEEHLLAGILLSEEVISFSFERDENNRLNLDSYFLAVPCTFLFEPPPARLDSQRIDYFEIVDIFKIYVFYKRLGLKKWACLKRNMKPTPEYIQKFKDAGLWDDLMEGLEENDYEHK